MDAVLRDIDRGIADLKAQLDAIRNILSPLAPERIATYYREPGWRALTALPGTYYMVLANIELLLASVCHELDPKACAEYFAQSLTSSESGYWSHGAISEGVADLAVKLGVLRAEDKHRLLAKRSWEHGKFRIIEVVSELQEQIVFLEDVVARLKQRLPASQDLQAD